MNIDSQDRILLTGAGFTKNFGGPLAKELWSIIFSDPILDQAPDVRAILLKDFDFESAYNVVMHGARLPFETEDGEADWDLQRKALGRAVNDAYEYIDLKVREFSFRRDAPYPVNIYKVQEFISAFAGDSNKPGYFFTLNQDLFIERHYYNGRRPTLPGIAHRPSWFTADDSQPLADERCVIQDPPGGIPFHPGDSPFYYLKLHGSCNWYTADRETMVIGDSKQHQIAAQPILAAYLDVFRSVLSGADRRLLCVGYSFSDDHINLAIKEGIQTGLRVYVLSPESPDGLAARLKQQQEIGAIIWRGLAGYYQYDFKTLFPADQSITAEWKMLQSRFFA